MKISILGPASPGYAPASRHESFHLRKLEDSCSKYSSLFHKEFVAPELTLMAPISCTLWILILCYSKVGLYDRLKTAKQVIWIFLIKV